MLTARDSLELAAVPNGKLYAVGGNYSLIVEEGGCGGFRSVVEEYDPATNTWSRKNLPSWPRSGTRRRLSAW
jgi:hypothetical protein